MSKNLENKIEGYDRVVNALKKLLKSVKGLILGVIGAGAVILYAWDNKDIFIQEGIKGFIHQEVVTETNENYSKSDLRKSDSAYIAEKFKSLEGKIYHNKNKIEENKSIIIDNTNHCNFNTKLSSIQSDILWEEMDKNERNTCGFEYRETNTKDNYGKFKDKYSSRIIYSVDLRSDCRAYYTPIDGDKTLIE